MYNFSTNKPLWPYSLNVDSPQAQGLVGWWPGDPAGGGLLYDLSGRNNHGTLTNGPLWKPGMQGGLAVLGDGINDYVSLPITVPNVAKAFTLSIWAYGTYGTPSDKRFQNINCYSRGSGTIKYAIFADYNTPAWSLQAGAGVAGGVFSLNKWFFACATFNGTTGKTYHNGKPVSSAAITVDGTVISAAHIGADVSNGRYWGGFTADNRIYDRDLSPAEVWSLYDPKTRWDLRWQKRKSYFIGVSGIKFDAASNSGFKTANADYNFARTASGANRYLTVKVAILGTPGTTVTAVTDDYDGTPVTMTKIGTASSSTGAGIIEFWGLAAPALGTKNIRVQLSGAVTSAALATSYSGVHQTSPTANFNSAQATNGVGAADATVTITTAATGSWVVAGIATTDATGIAAGQTSRNNINAAASAGAAGDEDTNLAVVVGTTAMTYPAIDALAVWVIGGFELRPVTASSLGTTINSNFFMVGF